jgi:hypothetical protein
MTLFEEFLFFYGIIQLEAEEYRAEEYKSFTFNASLLLYLM